MIEAIIFYTPTVKHSMAVKFHEKSNLCDLFIHECTFDLTSIYTYWFILKFESISKFNKQIFFTRLLHGA